MPRITRYWAHDPIGNSEGILAGYEPAALKAAQDRGIIFIAELDDAAADTSGDDARRRLRDAIAHLNDLTKGTGK